MLHSLKKWATSTFGRSPCVPRRRKTETLFSLKKNKDVEELIDEENRWLFLTFMKELGAADLSRWPSVYIDNPKTIEKFCGGRENNPMTIRASWDNLYVWWKEHKLKLDPLKSKKLVHVPLPYIPPLPSWSTVGVEEIIAPSYFDQNYGRHEPGGSLSIKKLKDGRLVLDCYFYPKYRKLKVWTKQDHPNMDELPANCPRAVKRLYSHEFQLYMLRMKDCFEYFKAVDLAEKAWSTYHIDRGLKIWLRYHRSVYQLISTQITQGRTCVYLAPDIDGLWNKYTAVKDFQNIYRVFPTEIRLEPGVYWLNKTVTPRRIICSYENSFLTSNEDPYKRYSRTGFLADAIKWPVLGQQDVSKNVSATLSDPPIGFVKRVDPRLNTNFIVSRAHEVVQALPLSANQYVCTRCSLRGSLKDLFGTKRCRPHIELATSGWQGEQNEPENFGRG